MDVIRHATAASFLEVATGFLIEAEAENGLMLGLAGDMPEPLEPADAPPRLTTVADGDRVVGCSLVTPPGRAVVSRGPDEALHRLARSAAEQDPDLPGVVGTREAALTFTKHWERLTGRAHTLAMEQGIYRLDPEDLNVPEAPGRMRVAAAEDVELLVTWAAAFQAEAASGDTSDQRAVVERRVGEGSIFVWEDGGPVSMAGVSGPTPSGIRVNLVYTPSERRGRGYASALVGCVSALMFERGRSFCMLYTDLGNPTSNKIYRHLGYRLVCDAAMVDFA